MNDYEKQFLLDTISIMYDYDGMDTVEGLKCLIDDMTDRLRKLAAGEVTEADMGVLAAERVRIRQLTENSDI